MLVAGVLALRYDRNAAIIVIVLFAVANAAGLFLWARRSSLSAYAGLQILLPVVGASSMAATLALAIFFSALRGRQFIQSHVRLPLPTTGMKRD